jgi:hypothetical protein
VPDDCARTVISLEANALLSHEVVNTPPPRGCFRISTVLWLYPTEPIERDYTPLHTANLSPEAVAAYKADAPARRHAANKKSKDKMGPAGRRAATKKGKAKMGPDRCRAADKKASAKMGPDRRRAFSSASIIAATKAARESNYSLGIRTLAQKEKCRKAGALPSVFMSAHKVVLSPHPN